MSRITTLFITILIFVASFSGVDGRPYLKIQNIQSDSYPYITVEVSVTNVKPIENLTSRDFEIYENGWKVGFYNLTSVTGRGEPKKIALLVDSSHSLSSQEFDTQMEGVQGFIRSLNADDKVSIISFNDSVEIHCGFTSSKEQALDCLDKIKQKGKNTVLFDAIKTGINISSAEPNLRSYIIVFTDGKEEKSRIVPGTLKELVKNMRLPVYVIGTGRKSNLNELAMLSQLSGGEVFFSGNLSTIGKIYLLLSDILNKNYVIRYLSQADFTSLNNRASLEVRFSNGQLSDQDVADFHYSTSILSYLSKLASRDLWNERVVLFFSGFLVLLILSFIFGRVSGSARKTKEIKVIHNVSPGVEKEPVKEEQQTPKRNQQLPENEEVSEKASEAIELPENYIHGYFIEKSGFNPGKKYQIKLNKTTIGHGENNHIILDDPTVSYNHARVDYKRGQFYIYDLISEYGVYINGKKLLRPRAIHDFDEIELGKTVLMFRRASG